MTQKVKNQEQINKLIKEYIDLPLLPTETEVNLANIIVYNWDTANRKILRGVKYSKLHDLNPTEYPTENSKYELEDYVTPVKVVDVDKNHYRILPQQWYALIDVHDGIHMRESFYSQKTFPRKLFIDGDKKDPNTGKLSNKWIPELLHIIGNNILGFLPPQQRD